MPISSRAVAGRRSGLAIAALEAIALTIVFGFLPELRVGPILDPHPCWIAVLVLSARYGHGGFVVGLTAASFAIAAGSIAGGRELASTWSRLGSARDVIALGACLVVAWIASRHIRRQFELRERLLAHARRTARARATIRARREVSETLRARVDRATTSLSFLRDVAARLEGGDPVAAAEGAADLALARSGARAVAVRAGAGEPRRLLVFRDTGGPDSRVWPDFRGADLVVPVRAGQRSIGAIALWGVPRAALGPAVAHDLDLIAAWCAPALTAAAWRVDGSDGRALELT